MLVYCARDRSSSIQLNLCLSFNIVLRKREREKKVWISCRPLINICKHDICSPNEWKCIIHYSRTQKFRLPLCNDWRVRYESKSACAILKMKLQTKIIRVSRPYTATTEFDHDQIAFSIAQTNQRQQQQQKQPLLLQQWATGNISQIAN